MSCFVLKCLIFESNYNISYGFSMNVAIKHEMIIILGEIKKETM